MSRISKRAKAPVSQRMYRHFALATVAITALVAVFADGETRDAVADRVQQERQAAAMRAADAERSRQGALARLASKAPASYLDTGSGDGDIGPVVPAGEGESNASPPPFAFAQTSRENALMPSAALRGRGANRPRVLPKGMAPEDYDENAYLSHRVGAARAVTQGEYETITAASAQRSSLQVPIE